MKEILNLLCIQSPSVQFWDCRTSPSQSFPPFFGAGLLHSLLLHCVHSVPQADHLLHSVHTPSTSGKTSRREKPGELDWERSSRKQKMQKEKQKWWRSHWEMCGMDLPVHRVVQGSFCMACPSHGSPPLRGVGFVQLLVRFWKPRPQRLLHGDHSVQVDQPPFTTAAKINPLSDQTNQKVNIFYTFGH